MGQGWCHPIRDGPPHLGPESPSLRSHHPARLSGLRRGVASFLLVADPDPERRARFVRQVRLPGSPLPDWHTGECAAGHVHVLWAAARRAPVSWAADGDGLAVLWGEAMAEGDDRRLGAQHVARAWAGTPTRLAGPWDGFYAAAVARPQG